MRSGLTLLTACCAGPQRPCTLEETVAVSHNTISPHKASAAIPAACQSSARILPLTTTSLTHTQSSQALHRRARDTHCSSCVYTLRQRMPSPCKLQQCAPHSTIVLRPCSGTCRADRRFLHAQDPSSRSHPQIQGLSKLIQPA
jgi:hypothetical protein